MPAHAWKVRKAALSRRKSWLMAWPPVLHALFDSMASADPVGAKGVALCAQGGFGANELAPKSDVDLLLVKPDDGDEATDQFLQNFLYALWDLKIDVGGGACRTITETLDLARADASERTALLSLKHIAGEPLAYAELEQRFREEVVAGTRRPSWKPS